MYSLHYNKDKAIAPPEYYTIMAILKINISVLHESNKRNYRHNFDKHRKIVGFAIMFDGISVYVMFGYMRVCVWH